MIKPKFWDDIKIAKLKREVRLLYIAMWNFADDSGVIISDPVWLKNKIFPYDTDIHITQFEKWIFDLERLGFIRRLRYRNQEALLYLPNFSRHQTINRPNEDDLNIPKSDLEKVLSDSGTNHGSITDQSVMNHCLREEEDKISKEEEKIKGKAPPSPLEITFPFLSDEFKKLWESWKNFREHEFKKFYKTKESEQAALVKICKISNGNEATANEIIMQSIANQWQGFWELKVSSNGKSINQNGKPGTGKITGEQLNEAYAKLHKRQ